MTADSSNQQIVSAYMDKIDSLVEVDYGDFKRKVGQYLLRLEQALRGQAGPTALLQQLRQNVVYAPTGQIDMARRQVLDGLQKIKSQVH